MATEHSVHWRLLVIKTYPVMPTHVQFLFVSAEKIPVVSATFLFLKHRRYHQGQWNGESLCPQECACVKIQECSSLLIYSVRFQANLEFLRSMFDEHFISSHVSLSDNAIFCLSYLKSDASKHK